MADGENRLFLLFYVQNLNGALTQSRITAAVDANESNFILDCRSVVFSQVFTSSVSRSGASSSPESNETQSYHHVKAIIRALI